MFYLDMVDNKSVDVESFYFGIRFSVLEHTKKNLTRLLWPSTSRVGRLELLGLSGTADRARESIEWNTTLFVDDGLQV